MEIDLDYLEAASAGERDTLSPRDRARVEELKRNQTLRELREVNDALARHGHPMP